MKKFTLKNKKKYAMIKNALLSKLLSLILLSVEIMNK